MRFSCSLTIGKYLYFFSCFPSFAPSSLIASNSFVFQFLLRHFHKILLIIFRALILLLWIRISDEFFIVNKEGNSWGVMAFLMFFLQLYYWWGVGICKILIFCNTFIEINCILEFLLCILGAFLFKIGFVRTFFSYSSRCIDLEEEVVVS